MDVLSPPVQDTPARREDLVGEILRLKRERGAVLLAHYYQDAEIQDLADFVGDSLELARAAQRAEAKVIAFCGVRFMAETAKILNPEAEVLIPDLEAGCSLEESCPPEAFARWRAAYPGAVAVTYINCSAAVKALSDIIVTSSSAEKIIRQIPAGRRSCSLPTATPGYLARKTGRAMVLWQEHVHRCTSSSRTRRWLNKSSTQEAAVALPECPEPHPRPRRSCRSTSSILRFVQEDPATEFLIATEPGIIHQMEKLAPGKRFIPVPGGSGECACNVCPYMRRNTLENLHACLRDGAPRLEIPEELRLAALRPLQRMLDMSLATPPTGD
jgi:quinolinate synthase